MTTDVVPAIDLRGVSFRYPASPRLVLDDVTMRVPAGQVVGIAGRNGSGKTTIARLLNGLLQPTTGTVVVAGLDTRDHPVRRLAARVGSSFQNPNQQLFAPTVRRELAFGPRNLGVAEREVEDRVASVAARLGLDTVLDRHPYHLELGTRKLVAIGAVVSMGTPILVLDEPTTGQDRRTADLVRRLVADLAAAGTTVVCVSHDTRLLADAADRIVVLHDGRIVADAEPRSLFADGELMDRAGLRPPQITRLSMRVGRATQPWPALSVAEAVDQVLALRGEAS